MGIKLVLTRMHAEWLPLSYVHCCYMHDLVPWFFHALTLLAVLFSMDLYVMWKTLCWLLILSHADTPAFTRISKVWNFWLTILFMFKSGMGVRTSQLHQGNHWFRMDEMMINIFLPVSYSSWRFAWTHIFISAYPKKEIEKQWVNTTADGLFLVIVSKTLILCERVGRVLFV